MSESLFQKWMQSFDRQMQPSRMSRQILLASMRHDLSAEDIAEILQTQPYYRMLLMGHVRSRAGDRSKLPLSSQVVALGMLRSRDLLLAAQLLRNLNSDLVPREDSGRLLVQENVKLKLAQMAQDRFERVDSRVAAAAYVASYAWDRLRELGRQSGLNTELLSFGEREFIEHLEEILLLWVQWRQKATRLLLPFLLLRPIGRIAALFLNPQSLSRYRQAKTHLKDYPTIRVYWEEREWGGNSEQLAYLINDRLGIFPELSLPLLFQSRPDCLNDSHARQLTELALTMQLGQNA